MILRVITLVGALSGAAGLSQFPEYSQQYLQRLSGAVNELRVVVAQFDASLEAVGKTREEAFAISEGSDLEIRLIQDGKANVERLAFLEDALDRLQGAPVLTRLFQAPMVADTKIATEAYEDFKPALPFTVEGVACAGLGFLGGLVLVRILIAVFGWPFRRRREVQA